MNQRENKRPLKSTDESIDAEQIEKTLNFFDAILDPYLDDVEMTSAFSPPNQRPTNLRRYTSENSLNHIITSVSTSTKPSSHSRPLRTTATSTEDLTVIPSEWTRKLNAISSNMVSASLIDLTSIDKTSSRPRFRFVPPSNSTETLKEEPELEQEYHLKTISTHPPTMTKPSHPIVKPIVIIPAVVKSAPINRLTETNIHHQNGNSAFKPHRASKTGVSAKIQQNKRAESTQKPHVQTNKTPPEQHPLLRHQQSMPQTHQSMLNLTSQTSYKSNGYPPPAPARAMLFDDPVLRRIQQVNNSSSIHGLVHSENRSPQSNYPHGSYLSANNSNRRHQNYYHPLPPPPPPKYQPSPSIYVQRNTGLPISSNVYHFHPNQSPRNGPSKRQSHYQNATITTYL